MLRALAEVKGQDRLPISCMSLLQIGHRDFDVEKRLRRDLKRTHALLADVQLLLETSGGDPGSTGSREELEKLRSQVSGGV